MRFFIVGMPPFCFSRRPLRSPVRQEGWLEHILSEREGKALKPGGMVKTGCFLHKSD
jgi:hypothetical protein